MAVTTLVLLFSAVLVQIVHSSEHTDLTVKTSIGYLVGFRDNVTFDGKTKRIAKFLGIPYAEPPVGLNRFRPPKPKTPLEEQRVVKEFPNRCIEMFAQDPTGPESEDCLYLNVFAPDISEIDSLPVMIFFHGGSFLQGSSNTYQPDFLTVFGQVIVVTANYRLGVWGFISSGDSNAPGNYGLWDQRLAIQWVRDNIEAFGGDKHRITIFGESAGASSVIYQGLYPNNKGLFQRIIAQSGSASASWASKRNQEATTERFAKAVGCYNESVKSMIECLRDLPANVINAAIHDISSGEPFVFLPTVDNTFVPCDPVDLLNADLNSNSFQLARETLASFDLMSGVNSGDGIDGMTWYNGYGDLSTFLPNKTYFGDVLVPLLAKSLYEEKLDANNTGPAIRAIRENYTDTQDPLNPRRIREKVMLMHGDASYVAPMQATMKLHAKYSKQKSYMYYLDVNPMFHLLPTPDWFEGANHADDIIYLFKTIPLNEQDTKMARLFVNMWSNFASTGDPSQPTDIGVIWRPYTVQDQSYLEITRNITSQSIKENLGGDKTGFWNEKMPEVIGAKMEVCDYKTETSQSPERLCFPYGVALILYTLFKLSCRIVH